MLENQPWLHYAQSLDTEWQQAIDEGKDVAYLKDICLDIAKRANSSAKTGKDCYDLAVAIREKLLNAPFADGYAYNEPSTLEEIRSVRPVQTLQFTNTLSNDDLKDKIRGAFIGRIAGCLLGKPIEGYRRRQLYPLLKGTQNYPMHKYICKAEFTDELVKECNINVNSCWADGLKGLAPVDDDTNYTVLALKLIDTYGKDFKPNDVLEAWLAWVPMFATCTAERVAYQNAAMGMISPETATHNNAFREWIGAQIRADFFGYVSPANPEKAAELAWRDASISHIKNGIYGAMFVAAMIASAFSTDCIIDVITAGLEQIPRECRLRSDVLEVIEWHKSGVTAEQAIENVHQKYDEDSAHWWCHTNSNAMLVVLGLLYGEKDFGKSICIAVQGAFDTDCNGATVGSIIGTIIGGIGIDPYWEEPFKSGLATSIDGYNVVTLDTLVDKTMSLID